MFQAMVHFCVLAENRALVSGLLYPLNRTVAGASDGSGIGARSCAGGNQDGIVAAPSSMNRASIIQCADIHMNGGCVGLVSDHRAAQSRVESNTLVRNRDKFWRRPTFFLCPGHALLPEGDL